MRRPVTDYCALKGCPHISWEIYKSRNPPNNIKRRRICLLAGMMPAYLTVCPLDGDDTRTFGKRKIRLFGP